MRELKHSSELQCRICRCILFTPTAWEEESLLADDHKPIDVILDLDPSQGGQPALWASFTEKGDGGGEGKVILPRRLISAFGGFLTDSELPELATI